jgi:thiol-disulfide isomerase/thioredoxin
MKKIVLLIVAVVLFSCQNEPVVDYVVVSGSVANKLPVDITINSLDRKQIQKIKLSEDGSFADTLKIEPGLYMFVNGVNSAKFYVEHGDNLVVNFDAADFKNSLSFEGNGAAENNYLIAKDNKLDELIEKGNAIFLLEEADYKQKRLDVKTALENLLASFSDVSSKFKELEQKNLNYTYLNTLNMYQAYHAHYAKKPDFKVSEDFLSELSDLNYGNATDFAFSPDYKNLVTSQIYKQAAEMAQKDSIASDIAFLKVAGALDSEFIKNELAYNNAKYGVTYTDDLEGFYAAFMATSTNETHKNEITETYNKLKTVAKGQPSPKFFNYENHAGGTMSFDDLKGKYVYIDVWATWCGPCKAEIPYLKDLHATYKNKNLHIVSISIDRAADHEKWKKMVTDEQLTGIQLFADKDWNSQFVTDYLIKGIPRFILVDPNGVIVSPNAPRPSDPALVTLFNELNI